MGLLIPNLLRQMAQHEVEKVREFHNRARVDYDGELVSLAKRLTSDDPDFEDFVADEAAFVGDLRELLNALTAIGLYRVVELGTKRALRWRYKPAEAKPLYIWTNLSRALRRDVGVTHKSLPQYATIDELRLVNNAVKHDGKVNKQVAKYTGWQEGEPFVMLESRLPDYMKAIPDYLFALATAVVPKGKP
jgi:hypothetical protein